MRTYIGYLALALAGSTVTATTTTDLEAPQRLAVVVPAYVGDLDRAVSSLGRWPSTCSPITQQNVDLVLYYAEGEEDAAAVDAAAAVIAETAGRCFSNTRTVYAHLSEEVREYVFGPIPRRVLFGVSFCRRQPRARNRGAWSVRSCLLYVCSALHFRSCVAFT